MIQIPIGLGVLILFIIILCIISAFKLDRNINYKDMPNYVPLWFAMSHTLLYFMLIITIVYGIFDSIVSISIITK